MKFLFPVHPSGAAAWVSTVLLLSFVAGVPGVAGVTSAE